MAHVDQLAATISSPPIRSAAIRGAAAGGGSASAIGTVSLPLEHGIARLVDLDRKARRQAKLRQNVLNQTGVRRPPLTVRDLRTGAPGLGLSALAERHLGKPLDKALQCSQWEVRPLTDAQRVYAALDATVVALVCAELDAGRPGVLLDGDLLR